jgi:hypothetical protein
MGAPLANVTLPRKTTEAAGYQDALLPIRRERRAAQQHGTMYTARRMAKALRARHHVRPGGRLVTAAALASAALNGLHLQRRRLAAKRQRGATSSGNRTLSHPSQLLAGTFTRERTVPTGSHDNEVARCGALSMAHKFKVGQVVTLHSKRHGVWAERFEVVKLLPHESGDFQYRIKSTEDGHERVAFECELVQ